VTVAPRSVKADRRPAVDPRGRVDIAVSRAVEVMISKHFGRPDLWQMFGADISRFSTELFGPRQRRRRSGGRAC